MKYYLLLLSLFAVIATSCSKKNTPAPIVLKSITLSQDTLIMYVGDARTLGVTLDPSTIDKATLSWNSSDPAIFSVTNKGVITAYKEGIAILTVNNSNKTVTSTALITVKPAKPGIDSLKIGLIAYYPFDHNSAIDSSGNGNDGTLFNISSVSDRFGKANSAYYFNGVDSYVKVNDNQDLRLSNTDFTITSWVKLATYNGSFGCNILAKHLPGNDRGWAWGITGELSSPTGVVTFGPGGTSASARGVSIVALNEWHMVTSTYSFSNNQISIYVDGVLDKVVNGIPSPNAAISSSLYIGRDDPSASPSGYFVHGYIDDIRIYKRALSSNDVRKLYVLHH